MSLKNELDRKKKISKLKELTAAAGTSNLDDAASKVASDVKKGLTKAVKGIGTSALQTGGVAGAIANKEKQDVAKKALTKATTEIGKEALIGGISGVLNKKDEDKKKKTGFR